jgi:hypothetical protein
MKFKKGDKVRLTQQAKQEMMSSISNLLDNGLKEHVEEFGDCIGTVLGPVDFNNPGEIRDENKVGPEIDVVWFPSRLRYAYDEDNLELYEKE